MKRIAFTIVLLIPLFFSLACGGGSGAVIPPVEVNDGRVENYNLLFPGRICRWDDNAFPLKVFVDVPPEGAGEYGVHLNLAVIEGIDAWNDVIDGIPVAFVHETDYDSMDIYVKWQTIELSGFTRVVEYDDHIAIHKIALSDELRELAAIELLMGHELGHVLGLDLSGVPGDLMFLQVNPLTTTLTQRDRDMINWLYSREAYVPIYTY